MPSTDDVSAFAAAASAAHSYRVRALHAAVHWLFAANWGRGIWASVALAIGQHCKKAAGTSLQLGAAELAWLTGVGNG
jgi:hypothetical protein